MPAKMARFSPSAAVRGVSDYGSHPCRQPVLPECGKSAKSTPVLGSSGESRPDSDSGRQREKGCEMSHRYHTCFPGLCASCRSWQLSRAACGSVNRVDTQGATTQGCAPVDAFECRLATHCALR